jgi:hypothetical protein
MMSLQSESVSRAAMVDMCKTPKFCRVPLLPGAGLTVTFNTLGAEIIQGLGRVGSHGRR